MQAPHESATSLRDLRWLPLVLPMVAWQLYYGDWWFSILALVLGLTLCWTIQTGRLATLHGDGLWLRNEGDVIPLKVSRVRSWIEIVDDSGIVHTIDCTYCTTGTIDRFVAACHEWMDAKGLPTTAIVAHNQ